MDKITFDAAPVGGVRVDSGLSRSRSPSTCYAAHKSSLWHGAINLDSIKRESQRLKNPDCLSGWSTRPAGLSQSLDHVGVVLGSHPWYAIANTRQERVW